MSKKVRVGRKSEWDAQEKARRIAEIALTKHAEDVALLRVAELSSLTEYYVFCSVDSEPQMRATVEAVDATLSKKGYQPLGIEGMKAAQWVLIDYNDVIFHIFRKEARGFYNLDRLWGDAPRIDIIDASPAQKGVVKRRAK